jgi:lipid A 3-O-deacylase
MSEKEVLSVMHSLVKFLLYAVLLVWALPIGAEDQFPSDQELQTFSLYIENDVFAGDDDQYTNGLKLTWSRYGLSELPDDALLHRWLYPVVKRLGFTHPEAEKALTFSIGQNIYTPRDIESTELIEDDRPYAGITYVEIGFHRKFQKQMHTFGLCGGIVGPHSYAEEIQAKVHELLNSSEAKGWDQQLKDEPVINVIYDYKRKLIAYGINDGFGGDMIINAGGGIGTVKTYANVGLSVRYGWGVPNDCGNFPIQPATCFNAELKQSAYDMQRNRFGAHLFASVSTQVVLRNVFLDGNTFRDSHSVDKKPVVGIFMGGIGLIVNRVKVVFSYISRAESFESQRDSEVFGSINFSFRY